MPIDREQTIGFITSSQEKPTVLGPILARQLREEYKRSKRSAPNTVLIGGSGQGTEVYAFGLAFPKCRIVAVDANVEIDNEVKSKIPDLLFYQELLHEFLSARSTTYDAVVISTGHKHGFTSVKELRRLVESVAVGGILWSGIDTLYPIDFQDHPEFSLKPVQTNITYLPFAWQRMG